MISLKDAALNISLAGHKVSILRGLLGVKAWNSVGKSRLRLIQLRGAVAGSEIQTKRRKESSALFANIYK